MIVPAEPIETSCCPHAWFEWRRQSKNVPINAVIFFIFIDAPPSPEVYLCSPLADPSAPPLMKPTPLTHRLSLGADLEAPVPPSPRPSPLKKPLFLAPLNHVTSA